MADFVKKTWSCGDTITADDLNRLENGVEEALDGGSVDCGYSCGEGWVTLTDESVTTAEAADKPCAIGNFAYSEQITADTIKVTFNGTEYTCNKSVMHNANFYGGVSEQGPDFSEYPFAVSSATNPFDNVVNNVLYTETAGTHQVKIEAFGETVETSECFRRAVKSVGGNEPLVVHVTGNVALSRLDKTWQEIDDAFPNAYAISSDGNVKMPISKVYVMDSKYLVDTNGKSFSTSAANDYPLYTSDMN